MKLWKILGALVLVAALGGAAFGAAAMLNVNSQGVQAGSALVPSCQGNTPVTVSYGIVFNQFISIFVVDSVTVSGISQNCFPSTLGPTDSIDVVLTLSGQPCPPTCFKDLGTMPITGSTVTYSLAPKAPNVPDTRPAAANVTDVHVVIQ